mgnify:CR=1 FL=1
MLIAGTQYKIDEWFTAQTYAEIKQILIRMKDRKYMVNDCVICFEPIINNNFKVNDISNLEKITHIFFSKKRKMINKAFNSLFKNSLQISKKMKIDLSLRPNQLSEEEYYKITEYFEKNFDLN